MNAKKIMKNKWALMGIGAAAGVAGYYFYDRGQDVKDKARPQGFKTADVKYDWNKVFPPKTNVPAAMTTATVAPSV